jgi:hypothetical protein
MTNGRSPLFQPAFGECFRERVSVGSVAYQFRGQGVEQAFFEAVYEGGHLIGTHGRWIDGFFDVASVAVAVSRRDVHLKHTKISISEIEWSQRKNTVGVKNNQNSPNR